MKRILATVAIAALSLTVVPTANAQDSTTTTTDGKLLLLLDSSGSMKESAGGQTKIAAAKAALEDVLNRLPDDSQVGVRVFGAKVFSAKDAGACTDTQNVVPVGTLDRDAITKAVAGYKPYGETPIGNALKGAAKDLGSEGKRTIVLLSDGEPTCSPDPCKVAKDLRAQGIDLTVNVVGLNVSGKARSALQCIADAGGGTYYGVDEPEELASSLVQVSVRALREFHLSGTPVTGGTSTADPLELKPGRYTDTTQGKATNRYYAIAKPKNADVTLSAVSRPPYDGSSSNKIEVELLTPDGEICEHNYGHRSNVLQKETVLSTGIVFSPHLIPAKDACVAAKTLLARVSLEAPPGDPFELLVGTRPSITNFASLPAEVSLDERAKAAAEPFEPSGTRNPVVGGATFSEAPTLKPGRYSDSIRPGEQLIYKIPVDWGQRPRLRATLESDVQAAKELGLSGIVAEVSMITPTLHSLGRTGAKGGGLWNGEDPMTMTGEGIELRARNIESSGPAMRSTSFDGDQYAVVAMGNPLGNDGSNFAAPLTISVDVVGSVTGKPKYAGKVTGPDSEKKPKKKEGGGIPWMPIGIGAGVVALLGAGFALGRRNRTPA